jgi:muramoyltetrapeptide carboxypeptidase
MSFLSKVILTACFAARPPVLIRGTQLPLNSNSGSSKCSAALTSTTAAAVKTAVADMASCRMNVNSVEVSVAAVGAEASHSASSALSFASQASELTGITRRKMLKVIYPAKLSANHEVRVIAPSRSLKIISDDARKIADQRLADLKLKVSFGKYVEEMDAFCSSSVASRIADLHEAFRNSSVKAIFTVIGGFNSNQLLKYIDWELLRNNPKILCGFSDITVLNNAIFAKTVLVTYYGPHYSTFGQKLHFDYTLDHVIKALWNEKPFEIEPSGSWSDDEWYKNQQARTLVENPGFLAINEGECEGRILGGNLSSFASLKGTPYFPDLTDSILFLEDDEESLPHHFDRLLQSLIQIPSFGGVRGIVIGRFQKASKMTQDLLMQIIKTKEELASIPVLADVDFGHTDPKITLPIGGVAHLKVSKRGSSLVIQEH